MNDVPHPQRIFLARKGLNCCHIADKLLTNEGSSDVTFVHVICPQQSLEEQKAEQQVGG